MSDLFRKYADLKKKVGGNRELFGYEETFGMPREEQQHITPPARYLVRILAECEFAIRLSKSLGGTYDGTVSASDPPNHTRKRSTLWQPYSSAMPR